MPSPSFRHVLEPLRLPAGDRSVTHGVEAGAVIVLLATAPGDEGAITLIDGREAGSTAGVELLHERDGDLDFLYHK